MILPTIIVASEEALRAVPQWFREGSLAALGATKWETIRRNVLPYAVPGMMTGSIFRCARGGRDGADSVDGGGVLPSLAAAVGV